MKNWMRVLSVVMILAMVIAFVPAMGANATEIAPSAAKTPGDYHAQVIQWINTSGVYEPGQGLWFIGRELESASYYYSYYFTDLDGSLMLESLVRPKSGNGTGIYLNMYLGENSSSFYVDSRVYKYAGGNVVEELPISCNDSRTYFTKNTHYQLEGSGGTHISLATAESWFNDGLQDMMLECDEYLYENLGFGIKCLGFVKYEGLGPSPEGVPTAKPGDMNGDNIISNDDVVALMWHNLFPQEYPLSANTDLNHDGVVDNNDVITLMWHNLFPENYPLS